MLTQFCAFGFLVDDEFDEGTYGRDPRLCADAVQRMVEVLDGLRDAEAPLERALADLWRTLTPGRSAAWRRQFANNIKGWLASYLWASIDGADGRLLGLEEFRGYRQLAVGMYMFLDLAEIVAAVTLPDELRYAPPLLEMRRAVAEHVAFLNDLFSADKECGHGFGYNLVLITERVHQCDRDTAVDRANAIVTGTVHNFLDARHRLSVDLCRNSLGVRQVAMSYSDALTCVLRGNFDWHFQCQRYTHPAELSGLPDYVSNLFGQESTP
ncbi:terpene synthase family protein [Streptomyces sp. NPDC007205]|uniref:terpene synthase family protein n=1 Tax=Streptomyces sp. NPDC007205 TaxID=3154316 RepID=UPI0033CD94B5